MFPMRKLRLITIIAGLLIAVCTVAASAATMYKYTDGKGNVFLTNDRTTIPERYQNSVEVLNENEATDGFMPEGKLAEEIRHKRQEGGDEGRVESAKARWYKENPNIEPSFFKRTGFFFQDLWHKIPFARIWPVLAAVAWTIVAFLGSRFIISQSKRRLMFFFSALTALSFVIVMYTLVLK
jgi:hypothetical protein